MEKSTSLRFGMTALSEAGRGGRSMLRPYKGRGKG